MNTADCSAPADQSTTVWYRYFSAPQWVIFGALICLGIILRWTLLDMRPYHHDESLHGMYGFYFYEFPNDNYYKYDPMLHGPMLYNSMRFIYAMFGDSLWAARTPVAIMGSLFILAPFLFRRFFSSTSVLFLTAGVAISPTMVYWSRFLREDFWVVTAMLMTVYGLTLARGNMKVFWVLLGITLQWCTKENIFVTLAIVFGYVVFDAFAERVLLSKDGVPCLAQRIWRYLCSHIVGTLIALTVSALVYCWFYSAGFRYLDGIVAGLGGEGFKYWAKHHGMERIQGPFNFHLYVLGWYELPFLVAFFAHVTLLYKNSNAAIKFCAAFIGICAILCGLFSESEQIRQDSLWSFFKLKDNLDIIGLFLLLFHAPLAVLHHVLHRERALAITGYFFTASFFVYSYLGEKVPWLTIYPYVFGLPYLALFFETYLKKSEVNLFHYSVNRALLWVGFITLALGVVFVIEASSAAGEIAVSPEDTMILSVGAIIVAIAITNIAFRISGTFNAAAWGALFVALFSIRATVQTNFLYAGMETEFLSQVHTTYELAELAKDIRYDVRFQPDAYKPRVYVEGDATWPLTFYFRGLKEQYKFTLSDPSERKEFTYLVQDWNDETKNSKIPEGFYSRKVNLRGWWVPDYNQMTLKNFLRYSINHYPWSPTGFSSVIVSAAKDTDRFKQAYTEE
jgi:uncharacterized protein (TIGR03663 family)